MINERRREEGSGRADIPPRIGQQADSAVRERRRLRDELRRRHEDEPPAAEMHPILTAWAGQDG